MKKTYRSYSLFELLIAIVVLSLLIIASYLIVPKLIQRAFDARRKADLDKIKKNLEMYYSLADEFPETLPNCGQPLVYKNQVLLSSFPCDPVTKEPYYYQTKRINNKIAYRLYAMLANDNDSSITKVGCQGGCSSNCLYNYGVSSMNIDLQRCSFSCTKSKDCVFFDDPEASGCSVLYYGDSTCNNECNNPSVKKCHDERGKHIFH